MFIFRRNLHKFWQIETQILPDTIRSRAQVKTVGFARSRNTVPYERPMPANKMADNSLPAALMKGVDPKMMKTKPIIKVKRSPA